MSRFVRVHPPAPPPGPPYRCYWHHEVERALVLYANDGRRRHGPPAPLPDTLWRWQTRGDGRLLFPEQSRNLGLAGR